MENLDLHMKDIELLLRCFAMAHEYRKYKPSLANFLNSFSKGAKQFNAQKIDYLQRLFESYLEALQDIDPQVFVGEKSRRFNIFLFETVFACIASRQMASKGLCNEKISMEVINSILGEKEFQEACVAGTTNSTNVFKRFDAAEKYLL